MCSTLFWLVFDSTCWDLLHLQSAPLYYLEAI
ncbi:hypothetical protein J729_4721, partial [Acinetobacter baumannii 929679-598]